MGSARSPDECETASAPRSFARFCNPGELCDGVVANRGNGRRSTKRTSGGFELRESPLARLIFLGTIV